MFPSEVHCFEIRTTAEEDRVLPAEGGILSMNTSRMSSRNQYRKQPKPETPPAHTSRRPFTIQIPSGARCLSAATAFPSCVVAGQARSHYFFVSLGS